MFRRAPVSWSRSKRITPPSPVSASAVRSHGVCSRREPRKPTTSSAAIRSRRLGPAAVGEGPGRRGDGTAADAAGALDVAGWSGGRRRRTGRGRGRRRRRLAGAAGGEERREAPERRRRAGGRGAEHGRGAVVAAAALVRLSRSCTVRSDHAEGAAGARSRARPRHVHARSHSAAIIDDGAGTRPRRATSGEPHGTDHPGRRTWSSATRRPTTRPSTTSASTSRPGELFAFLGPNGAGKTTTISILTTTLAKTRGTVRIAGHDLDRDATAVRRSIGIIFQNPSLDLHLSGEENIRLHVALYGLYGYRPFYRAMPAEYRERIEELADVVGLGDEVFRPLKTYSGGMKRKLEIIRSLMHRPSVLFLDEPTSGLDPVSRHSPLAVPPRASGPPTARRSS